MAWTEETAQKTLKFLIIDVVDKKQDHKCAVSDWQVLSERMFRDTPAMNV